MSNGRNFPNESMGHRKRLRDRFLTTGIDSLQDYEVVELLLTLATPRKDCKQIAKDIIHEYKNLTDVLNSNVEDMRTIKGVGPVNTFGIRLFQEIIKRYSKEKVKSKKMMNCPDLVYDYLRQLIGKEKKEHFVILYIDTHKNLLKSDVSIGILNASIVHPREVFEKAILNHSSEIIVAHNHPSGDVTPSSEDIATTERLVNAGKLLGITVTDHMIICSNDYFSMREKGLIV